MTSFIFFIKYNLNLTDAHEKKFFLFLSFRLNYIYRVACVDVGVVLQMVEDLVQVAVACRA